MNTTELSQQIRSLTSLIKDAYMRMATNRDEHYRKTQLDKINKWLEELTTLHEQNQTEWIQTQ